jgi:hypothetical protein
MRLRDGRVQGGSQRTNVAECGPLPGDGLVSQCVGLGGADELMFLRPEKQRREIGQVLLLGGEAPQRLGVAQLQRDVPGDVVGKRATVH